MTKRIYVIYDDSYEWDDLWVRSKIVYIGTNRKEAIKHFNKYYGDTPTLDARKWKYDYSLYSYPAGWNKIDDLCGEQVELIIQLDNVPKDEDKN